MASRKFCKVTLNELKSKQDGEWNKWLGDHKVFQDTKSSPVPPGRWEVAGGQDSLEEEPLEGGRAQQTQTGPGKPSRGPLVK